MGQGLLPTGAAPSTPAAGYVSVYAKTADKLLYAKDDAGNETLVSGSAALAGNAAQVFSAAPATAAAHATRLDQMQAPFRNRIINGDMSVSQVNGTTLVTTGIATNTYVIDQMIVNAATAAVTAGQSTDATGLPTGFKFNLKIAGAASNTGVKVKHRMEGKDVARFAGKKIAISVWLYQDSGAAMASATMKAYCPTTTEDTFSALTQEGSTQTFSIANAGTIAKYTQFITMGASNVAKGLEIEIDTAAGVLAGKVMYATGLQIEAVVSDAAVGTEFEFIPFKSQFDRCSNYLTLVPIGRARIAAYDANTLFGSNILVRKMRTTTPALSFSADPIVINTAYVAQTGFSFSLSIIGTSVSGELVLGIIGTKTSHGLTDGSFHYATITDYIICNARL